MKQANVIHDPNLTNFNTTGISDNDSRDPRTKMKLAVVTSKTASANKGAGGTADSDKLAREIPVFNSQKTEF